jgi:hypothetical protein
MGEEWHTAGFERKLISLSTDLQSMREYSNLGLISTFHLNHF